MIRFIILFTLLLPATLAAENGKLLYTTYCSACHGVDGVGPKDNVNPPLAKSEWLLGKPDRAIAAVMVGLSGPIEVSGKAYNLIMPPQGGVLNDVQLAAILTHVRSSWGNQESAVEPIQVAHVRAKLKGRTLPYTGNELRKEYPIPYSRGWPRIENLISRVYHGKWELMPDFSELEPISVEEEARNLIDVAHAAEDKKFGIVWTGDLMSKKEADYRVTLDGSDGSALYINGSKVVEIEGLGHRGSERARTQRVRLLKGKNEMRLEYFNRRGKPGLSFQINGPGGLQWLSESRLKVRPAVPPIPLKSEEGYHAVIYRNFIEGAEARAIGVGYDEGVNQAFSVTQMGPEVIWQGAFLDAGLHWTGRGRGKQRPSGTDVVKLLNKPAYALLPDQEAKWPEQQDKSIKAQFKGYSLDLKGRPSFRYELAGIKVSELFKPSRSKNECILKRVINFQVADPPPSNLYLALASGVQFKESGDAYLLDDKVTLKTDADVLLRKLPESQILVPLTLEKGNTQITVQYSWKKR